MDETRKFRCDKSKEDILKLVVAHFEKAKAELDDTKLSTELRMYQYDALWKLMRDLKVYEE